MAAAAMPRMAATILRPYSPPAQTAAETADAPLTGAAPMAPALPQALLAETTDSAPTDAAPTAEAPTDEAPTDAALPAPAPTAETAAGGVSRAAVALAAASRRGSDRDDSDGGRGEELRAYDLKREVRFLNTEMLKANLGVTAFKDIGFGIYSTSGSAAVCHKMATAFGPTPPTDVKHWDFTNLPDFKWDDAREVRDFVHLEVSEAARMQNAYDGRGPTEGSSSRRIPLADQRGQVNLWAGSKSASLLKDRQALPLNFHDNRRLRQGTAAKEAKEFEQCGSRTKSARAHHSFATWALPFWETDETCRAIIATIGDLIHGHRAGRRVRSISRMPSFTNAMLCTPVQGPRRNHVPRRAVGQGSGASHGHPPTKLNYLLWFGEEW